MPVKVFSVDGIGDVKISKRRGTKKISLKISGAYTLVTQPAWLPYGQGLQFALQHQHWIAKQKQDIQPFLPEPDAVIGKTHRMHYRSSNSLKSRVTANEIIIFIPPSLHIHSPAVLELTKKAVKKALKIQAKHILLERLEAFVLKYHFNYNQLRFKSMRTRWGSCTSQHNITLNISLLMLPYELIDYVILHELMHTRLLNHSKEFWQGLAVIMPDYKQRRKDLKSTQHNILTLY